MGIGAGLYMYNVVVHIRYLISWWDLVQTSGHPDESRWHHFRHLCRFQVWFKVLTNHSSSYSTMCW